MRWNREPRTLRHGMPRNTLDASAMMDTVVPIALRRNVHLAWISLEAMEARKDANVPDEGIAITRMVFANASMDTLVTGVNPRLF